MSEKGQHLHFLQCLRLHITSSPVLPKVLFFSAQLTFSPPQTPTTTSRPTRGFATLPPDKSKICAHTHWWWSWGVMAKVTYGIRSIRQIYSLKCVSATCFKQDCAIFREAAECYWKCEVCMRGGPSPSWLVEGVRLIALIHRPALLTDRGEHSACFPMRHHHHHHPHQLTLNRILIPMFTFVLYIHICPFYSVAKSAPLPNP